LPLDAPLVSIGRRIDNDIVLDSSAVSRHHAQIRWRYGRFVLYDVGGRGSTAVNGQSVTEYVLQAGDVIALSNVSIIYGEGLEKRSRRSTGDSTDQTLLMPKS
jgi:pSer/pThr/pTyr-binding forkhead associated (FHA) protein